MTRLPRVCGRVGEYGGGAELYPETPDHSLPCVVFGESGSKWPFIIWCIILCSARIEPQISIFLRVEAGDLEMMRRLELRLGNKEQRGGIRANN